MSKHTSDIRIIGARASGKTTYLATLLRCPKGLEIKYPGIKVLMGDDKTDEFRKIAIDILENDGRLAPTEKDYSKLHSLANYSFEITAPPATKRPKIELELIAKDFPGEFFEDIPVFFEDTSSKNTLDSDEKEKMRDWIDDLFMATSWMVLMTDWETEKDETLYLPAFKKLYEEFHRKKRDNAELEDLRIAVVMTQCDRGELWPCRLDPDEDLFEIRLPKTYEFLTSAFSSKQVQFFASSAFGVLSDRHENFDPRPNCKLPDDGSPEAKSVVLRDPESWYPYGLIPPLYWLATGICIEE